MVHALSARVPLLLPVLALARQRDDVRRHLRPAEEAPEPSDRAEVEFARLGEALAAAADIVGVRAGPAEKADVQATKRIGVPRGVGRQVAPRFPVVPRAKDGFPSLERLRNAVPGFDGAEVEQLRDRTRGRRLPTGCGLPVVVELVTVQNVRLEPEDVGMGSGDEISAKQRELLGIVELVAVDSEDPRSVPAYGSSSSWASAELRAR